MFRQRRENVENILLKCGIRDWILKRAPKNNVGEFYSFY